MYKQIYISTPEPRESPIPSGRIPSYLPELETSGSPPHLPNSIQRGISFPLLCTGRLEVEKVKAHYQKFVKRMLLKLYFKMRFHTITI